MKSVHKKRRDHKMHKEFQCCKFMEQASKWCEIIFHISFKNMKKENHLGYFN